MCQVQYFRCLREVPRDPTYLRSFCVAGAIFSMPPRSSCVTRTQGSLVAPPLFCGRCQLFRCLREVARDTAKGCLWPYLLVNNFAASWPYLPLGKSHKWLTPCLREGPLGRLRVGSQATAWGRLRPYPDLSVTAGTGLFFDQTCIFAWHGLCPDSRGFRAMDSCKTSGNFERSNICSYPSLDFFWRFVFWFEIQ